MSYKKRIAKNYLKGKSLKRKEIHLSIRSNIQYWENCWQSQSITFLPRQCVQENLAADVHNTFHFNQASSHSCGRVACQEDNTMAEREKHRVEGQTCTWVGGGICGGQWCAANPVLSGLQDELWTKQQYINNVFIVCGCTRVSSLESIKGKTESQTVNVPLSYQRLQASYQSYRSDLT